jgi:hypothetical protein
MVGAEDPAPPERISGGFAQRIKTPLTGQWIRRGSPGLTLPLQEGVQSQPSATD